ncbi:MAG TPA: ABC transporter permease [Streptosporangiaceae bacterium]|jgi:ABC-2 type transport system permease protein|nr:ABC transporter permease [Streptosporangiaceae bacterium]
MTSMTYVRYEVVRNFRVWQFVFFALAWPIIVFFTVTSANRHATFDGIGFPLYFMAGMAAMGTISGVVSRGSLIAAERSIGWTRQMRITPLRAGAYFGAKVLCGYLMALLTVGAMCLAGAMMGVRLSAGHWLAFAGLLLVGLVPFAVLGILLGHLLKPEALLPAVAGTTTLLALLGGAYGFLVATSGPVFEVIRALPSYWLVQAGKTALGHGGWPAEGWIVIAAWTAVLVPLTVLAYRRDTSRV